MADDELEAFKLRIDLRQYAQSLGYQKDRRESSANSWIMRNAQDDKIIVARSSKDRHWAYKSVRDPDGDTGSIIDFLQKRRGLSLGRVRQELRPWIGRPSAPPSLFPPMVPVRLDRGAVEVEYARMQLAPKHAYLEQERRIPAALLASPRFLGRVRIDSHSNAIFPHFDLSGLCGFEKKNRGFTGFASGGTKGLWESHDLPDDHCLIVAESAIDALSYAALFPDGRARYRSIGGQVNEQQPALIRAAILDLPDGSEVIAATDNDDAGRKLAAMLEKAVTDAGRPAVAFRAHFPVNEGADWNDALRQNPIPLPFPTARL
jgi:hypothetical protein